MFVAVAGEEQGLNGSRHLAQLAKAEGWPLEAVLNNDIVGGDTTPGDDDAGQERGAGVLRECAGDGDAGTAAGDAGAGRGERFAFAGAGADDGGACAGVLQADDAACRPALRTRCVTNCASWCRRFIRC